MTAHLIAYYLHASRIARGRSVKGERAAARRALVRAVAEAVAEMPAGRGE